MRNPRAYLIAMVTDNARRGVWWLCDPKDAKLAFNMAAAYRTIPDIAGFELPSWDFGRLKPPWDFGRLKPPAEALRFLHPPWP